MHFLANRHTETICYQCHVKCGCEGIVCVVSGSYLNAWIRSSSVGWLWLNASCVGVWWRVWVHYGVSWLQSRVLVGDGVNGLLSSLSCPLSSHLSPLLSCSPPSSPFPSLPLTLPLILFILYAVDEGLHGQNVLQ